MESKIALFLLRRIYYLRSLCPRIILLLIIRWFNSWISLRICWATLHSYWTLLESGFLGNMEGLILRSAAAFSMNCLGPFILLKAVANLPVTEHFPDDRILRILHFFLIFKSITFFNIEVHLRVVKVSGNIGGKHCLLILLVIFDLKGSWIIIMELWLFIIVLLVLLFIFIHVFFFLFLVLILLRKRRRHYLFVVSGEIQMMLGDAAVWPHAQARRESWIIYLAYAPHIHVLKDQEATSGLH